MKSIHVLIVLSLALTVCLGCSRNPGSSAPLSQPPNHGTAFLLKYDVAEIHGDSNALQNLEDPVNKRLSKLSISVYWETASNNEVRLLTSITQQSEIAGVENRLAQRGMLEFRLVKEDSDILIQKGESAPGYELMTQTNVMALKVPKSSGLTIFSNAMPRSSTVTAYLVKKEPELAGKYVQKAWVTKGVADQPEIEFELNQEGAKLFETVTGNNVGRQLAIVVDGRIFSAPIIRDPIPGGKGMIAGNFTPKEALELADVLDCPLPFPIKVTVEKTY